MHQYKKYLLLTNIPQTLTTFFSVILPKKYTNPSSDIIAILAGLDQVDVVFADFVGALDGIIRNGKTSRSSFLVTRTGQDVNNRGEVEVRQRAVEVVLSITSGAYQTSLLTYFIQRDLFPAIMKVSPFSSRYWHAEADIVQFIQESDTPFTVKGPFTLLGLLANYNKFEFQNPYQLRLNDFVNEAAIQKIIKCVGHTCRTLRGQYIDILQDLPEGWSFANTLSMIGLGAIAPGAKANQKPTYDPEVAKQMFAKL